MNDLQIKYLNSRVLARRLVLADPRYAQPVKRYINTNDAIIMKADFGLRDMLTVLGSCFRLLASGVRISGWECLSNYKAFARGFVRNLKA
jgi:hypothetical protein